MLVDRIDAARRGPREYDRLALEMADVHAVLHQYRAHVVQEESCGAQQAHLLVAALARHHLRAVLLPAAFVLCAGLDALLEVEDERCGRVEPGEVLCGVTPGECRHKGVSKAQDLGQLKVSRHALATPT
ncbi:hypothetical protein NOCA2360083 [metagenome]|uniref:Uncharacterized protein n=1 Tax=metagenome TaxID=256318 RepID=A0A2P2C7P4_9ZZZZ